MVLHVRQISHIIIMGEMSHIPYQCCDIEVDDADYFTRKTSDKILWGKKAMNWFPQLLAYSRGCCGIFGRPTMLKQVPK